MTMVMGAMYLTARFLPIGGFRFEAGRYFAFALLAIGISLGAVAVIQFKSKGTTVSPVHRERGNRLVRSGVYRISRNPMYLGLLCILIAGFVHWGNAFNILWLPLFVSLMERWWIRPEEAFLKSRYPKEFEAYRQAVRRWF